MIILETKQSVQCCRSAGRPNGVHTKFLWHADFQDIVRYQLNWEKQLREVRESWKVLGELTEEPCGTGWAAGVGRLGGRAGTGKVWKGSTELVVEWEAEGKTSQRWHWGGSLEEWVDKMSCRRLWDQSEHDSAWLGELSACVISSLRHRLMVWIVCRGRPAPVLEALQWHSREQIKDLVEKVTCINWKIVPEYRGRLMVICGHFCSGSRALL